MNNFEITEFKSVDIILDSLYFFSNCEFHITDDKQNQKLITKQSDSKRLIEHIEKNNSNFSIYDFELILSSLINFKNYIVNHTDEFESDYILKIDFTIEKIREILQSEGYYFA